MIKLFRRIRYKLLSENEFSKYLIYAIGEILLVVIGILIALQINNWNESSKMNRRELALLSELKTNLEINTINLENDIQKQIKSVKSFNYILNLPNSNLPYSDSIPAHLTDIEYAPDVILVSSAFQTLKSFGLELIQSDSLRIEIVNLFEVDYPKLMQETRRLEDQLWSTAVIPLFQKHLSNDKSGWIPNNYNRWLSDTEFFNMISFRLNLRESSTTYKKKAVEQTMNVISLLEKELINRKESTHI